MSQRRRWRWCAATRAGVARSRPVDRVFTGGSVALPADDIDRFDSGIDELDRWLRSSARVAAAAGTAASYVLYRGERVVGYYALATSAVGHGRSPSRLRRGMPDPAPVVLLARLALDRSEHGSELGGHLLVDALRRCVRGGHEFSARAVVVDAINDDATRFYQHFGFHQLDEARLWRRIGDIESSLRSDRRATACAVDIPQ